MATPPPTSTPSATRLERSSSDRIISGVCGGMGRAFGVDPTLVRIATAVLVLLGGVGAIAYLAAWLLIPEEGETEPLLHRGSTVRASTPRLIGGAALVVVAVIVVGNTILPNERPGLVWPIILGLAGAILLLVPNQSGGARTAATETPAGAPPTPAEPVTPAAAPPATDAPAVVPPADPSEAPTAATTPVTGITTPAYGGAPERPIVVAPPVLTASKPKRRRPAAPVAFGVILIGAAVLSALATAGVGLTWEAALAGLVLLSGIALAGASLWGGSPALVAVAFLFAAVVAVPIAAHLHLSGGAGDRLLRPATAAQAPTSYQLAAGQLRIDLREAAAQRGGIPKPVRASVGLGRMVVVVPEAARVTVDAHVAVGNLEVVDHFADGTDLDHRTTFGPASGPPVTLHLDVDVGSLEIRRGNPPWPTRDGRTTNIDLTAALPTPSIDRISHATA